MKRHPFNLIELMLALGVIVVGLVSVMALFPVGANANRDAMAENYSSQSAEQILSSLSYYLCHPTNLDPVADQAAYKAWWSTEIAKIDDLSSITTPEGVAQRIADQQQPPTTANPYTTDCPGYMKTVGGNIYRDNSADLKSGFRIQSDTGTYKDFEAMMALWQEPIEVNGITVLPQFGITLNLEISWPAQLPYSARQKARYRLDVFNPNEN